MGKDGLLLHQLRFGWITDYFIAGAVSSCSSFMKPRFATNFYHSHSHSHCQWHRPYLARSLVLLANFGRGFDPRDSYLLGLPNKYIILCTYARFNVQAYSAKGFFLLLFSFFYSAIYIILYIYSRVPDSTGLVFWTFVFAFGGSSSVASLLGVDSFFFSSLSLTRALFIISSLFLWLFIVGPPRTATAIAPTNKKNKRGVIRLKHTTYFAPKIKKLN